MANKVVQVQGFGNVAFPDTMSDTDISAVLDKQFGGAKAPSAASAPEPGTVGGILKSLGHDLLSSPITNPLQFLNAPKATQPLTAGGVAHDLGQAAQTPIANIGNSETFNYLASHQPQDATTDIIRHTAQFAGGLTTPENVAIGAALGPVADVLPGAQTANIVRRGAAGYFGVQGAKGAYQSGKQAITDAQQGKQFAGDATDAGLNALMAGAGGLHVFHGAEAPAAVSETTPAAEPQATPAAPSAASQIDAVHFPSDSARQQFDVLSQYLKDQYAQPEGPVNERPLANGGGVIKPRQLALPTPSAELSVKGESLPPQTAEAGPMSPEAEAASQAAAEHAQTTLGPNTPQAGSEADTRGSAPSDIEGMEAQMRPQIGQILRLQQLLDSDEPHDALRRGIRGASGINGSLLSDEDRDHISQAIGEPVGTTLTPDQQKAALDAAGLQLGEPNPKFLNTQKLSGVTREILDQHRDAMASELATTTDEARKAKLQAALTATDSKGRPKPALFTRELSGKDTVPVPEESPLAPFATEQFNALHPQISLDNLRSVLGPKVARNKHLGMLTDDERAGAQAAPAPDSEAGTAAFNENSSGMSVDEASYRKAIDSAAQAAKTDNDRLAVARMRDKLSADLAEKAQAHAAAGGTSEGQLAHQLRALPADMLHRLPKELQDLAKAKDQQTGAANATDHVQPAAQANTSETAPSSAATAGPDGSSFKAAEVANAATKGIQKDFPEASKYIQRVRDVAEDHFGDDIEGRRDAMAEGLRVLHEGLQKGSPNALKAAFQAVRTHEPYGETYYSGLDVGKAFRAAKHLFNPKLSEEQHAAADQFYGEQLKRNLRESGQKQSPLEKLTDSLPAKSVSPTQPLSERIHAAISHSLNSLKANASDMSKTMAEAKGFVAAMFDNYRRPEEWTDFKDATGKFSGAKQASANLAKEYAKKIVKAVPDKVRREAITNFIQAGGDEAELAKRAAATTDAQFRKGYEIAADLTPGEKAIAKAIDQFHQEAFDEGQKAGVLSESVENYVRQAWKRPNKVTGKIMAQLGAHELDVNGGGINRHRVFGSYFEGEQAGFTPVDKDVAAMTATYHQSLNSAIASRTYIKSLLEGKGQDGRPLAEFSGHGKQVGDPGAEAYMIHPRTKPSEAEDYRPTDHPALRGWKWTTSDSEGKPIFVQSDMLLHPEIYKHVSNVLGKSALREFAPTNFILRGGAAVKGNLLSLSLFHPAQLTVHAVEHMVNPLKMADVDLNEPEQRKLVDHGLMIASFHEGSAFAEGLDGKGALVNKIPGVGHVNQAIHNFTFRDYLPKLKMNMALHALERNRERYAGKLDEDQIQALTARQANAAFGGLNYDLLGRNKTMQDVFRMAALAPDFLEARTRFVAQALKPFNREQSSALIRGAAGLYVAARVANYAISGDPKWDHRYAFSIVAGGKEYKLRTIQGDILEAIDDPRTFTSHRLNPTTTRPFLQMATGRDDFGRKISTVDVAKNLATNNVAIPFRGVVEKNNQSLFDTLLTSVGLQSKKYRTPLQQDLRTAYFDKHPPEGEMKPADRQLYDLAAKYRSGQVSYEQLKATMAKGDIDPAKLQRVLRTNPKTDIQRWATGVNDPSTLLKLIDEGSPDEQRQLAPIIAKRLKDLPLKDREPAVQKLRTVMQHLSKPEAVPSQATHVYDHATGTVSPNG